MRFNMHHDGSITARGNIKGAITSPDGYVAVVGEPNRFVPILATCQYRTKKIKKSSCCGDKELDYCNKDSKYVLYMNCKNCKENGMEPIDAAQYQKIYDAKDLHYGSAEHDRCPGVRFLPQFKDFLRSPVIDLGCGTGDTVRAMRDLGFVVNGMDWIDRGLNHVVCDITEPQDLSIYTTATCIDVMEHIYEERLPGLIKNLQQVSRQVVTVHCGPSREWGFNRDLHVNIKTPKQWEELLSQYFNIVKVVAFDAIRYMYLMESK